MAHVSALKLAEGLPFFRRALDLSVDAEEGEGRGHSLHYAISLPERALPEVASHFLERYSEQGDLVLDPFTGNSNTALEAVLMGRRIAASGTNPMAVKISKAKSYPADIEFVALGLLQGHGAGFFSVYTFPQISLAPAEQLALNTKRGQEPDYRAVVPRILRKTASVLRDGVPSAMRRAASESAVTLCDPRDMPHIAAASIDLVLTSPPLPDEHNYAAEMWLRCWFSGLTPRALVENGWSGGSVDAWLEYMNEVLTELARVVKGGRRALIDLGEVRLKDGHDTLDDLLVRMVEDELGRYWDAEGAIEVKHKHAALKHCLKPRESSRANRRNVVLVLRRR